MLCVKTKIYESSLQQLNFKKGIILVLLDFCSNTVLFADCYLNRPYTMIETTQTSLFQSE